MNTHSPRYLTNDELHELEEIWRRIKSLRALKHRALEPGQPGAWIAEAADKALQLEFQRLDALYRETHPTLPRLEP